MEILKKTGRKMDAAWKAAISAGLKARHGAGAAFHKADAVTNRLNTRINKAPGKAFNFVKGEAFAAKRGILHSKLGRAVAGSGAARMAGKASAAVAGAASKAANSPAGKLVTKGVSAAKQAASAATGSKGGKLAGAAAQLAGGAAKSALKSRSGKVAIVAGAGGAAYAASKKRNTVKARVKRAVGM